MWMDSFKFFTGSSKMSEPEPTATTTEPEPTATTTVEPEPTATTTTEPEPTATTTTEPEPVPEPESTAPVEIPAPLPFSIEDLINSVDVILAKETTDRASVLNFVNMPIDSIKPKLYIWASIGFPSSYMVSTFELTAPSNCSDGVRRTHVEYFEYLMNGKMNDWLNSMNAKTSGMYFTFSHNGYSCINLHISK